MQTFLPYTNFRKCAEVLDYRRLGKQRVEAMQILQCLEKPTRWKNHPAVKMWEGYELALMVYTNEMITEWIKRGYKNTMKFYKVENCLYSEPFWMGDERVHSSHRANLLRKDIDFYSKYGWKEEPIEGYWWPFRKVDGEWVNYF